VTDLRADFAGGGRVRAARQRRIAVYQSVQLGAVHAAGSATGLAEAVRDVLGHRDALHRRIMRDGELRERFSWRARADKVRTIYDELLGELPDEVWKEEALHVGGLLGRRLA
jgi:hypothetical protein